MRRAVIVVNIVMVSILVIDIFAALTVSHVEFDDDEVNQAIKDVPIRSAALLLTFEALCFGIGIWGAVAFSTWQIYVALTMYSINFFVNLFSFNLAALLMAGFFAYPHIFFIQEIRKGIMTRDNYHNEEQSCCCV